METRVWSPHSVLERQGAMAHTWKPTTGEARAGLRLWPDSLPSLPVNPRPAGDPVSKLKSQVMTPEVGTHSLIHPHTHKSQPTEWGKVLSNQTSDSGF